MRMIDLSLCVLVSYSLTIVGADSRVRLRRMGDLAPGQGLIRHIEVYESHGWGQNILALDRPALGRQVPPPLSLSLKTLRVFEQRGTPLRPIPARMPLGVAGNEPNARQGYGQLLRELCQRCFERYRD